LKIIVFINLWIYSGQIRVIHPLLNPKYFQKKLTPEVLVKLKAKIKANEVDLLNHDEEIKRKTSIKETWDKSKTEHKAMINVSEEDMKKDIASTKDHILSIPNLQKEKMMEIAAGSCRIYSSLFAKMFKYIEIVEPSENLVNGCVENLKTNNVPLPKVIHVKGLEEVNFSKSNKFNLVFGQYLAENVSDLELINFLINVRKALSKDSTLFLKENIHKGKGVLITSAHHQRIRTLSTFLFFFEMTDFCYNIIKSKDWNNFPLFQMALNMKDKNTPCKNVLSKEAEDMLK